MTRSASRCGWWLLASTWACAPASAPENVVLVDTPSRSSGPDVGAAAGERMEARVGADAAVIVEPPVLAAGPQIWPTAPRWIAAGGGSLPEFNQVSIEQDLELARASLGAGGVLLFAGGPASHGVQVRASATGDPLLAALGDLFAPRGGRTATYRRTTLPADAAATIENVRAAIEQATASEGPPLLLYLAGHGQRGEQLADAIVDLWGQVPLSARELALLLDTRARPVRVVITSCFSGGFAELAFVGADAQARRPAPARCGLFAATAEREASGCDPNPDRAAQEGYGLHFLHALRGQDRDGAAAQVDLDGDGQVSLLEAHARARVASAGIDVPTTTSERWLRAVPGLGGRAAEVELREESAVISALAGELGLAGREGAASGALADVLEDMSEVTGRIDEGSAAEDAAYRRTAAQLLARWPVLDDPWHPEFAATLASSRVEIDAALAASEAYQEYVAARAQVEAAQAEHAALLARSAKLERLVRAVETRTLAGQLRARGGADWRAYERLLACERWVP